MDPDQIAPIGAFYSGSTLFGPRSDCSYRSNLFWVHTVCFNTLFVSNVRQLFAADDFSRRHFQMHFFLGALRVKIVPRQRRAKQLEYMLILSKQYI